MLDLTVPSTMPVSWTVGLVVLMLAAGEIAAVIRTRPTGVANGSRGAFASSAGAPRCWSSP